LNVANALRRSSVWVSLGPNIKSSNRFLETIGAILTGLVAGFASTVVIVLGFMLLSFLAGWGFGVFGGKQLGYSTTTGGLASVYYPVPVCIFVGLIVRYRVRVTRLHQKSVPSKTN
jgi:hypothetical protein